MKQSIPWKSRLGLVLMVVLAACATTESPYFETPPGQILQAESKLFKDAVEQQNSGQTQSAIGLWKQFLAKHPNSFEAHNNLGMSYYHDDQLNASIEEFEKALELEPSDLKVRGNLTRALKFQTTLLKENKEYERAIANLQMIAELSATPQEEFRVKNEIDELQGKIFKQTERINTINAYKSFIKEYPNSKYRDRAMKKIEELSRSPIIHSPRPQKMFPYKGTTIRPSPSTMRPSPSSSTMMEEENIATLKIPRIDEEDMVSANQSLKNKEEVKPADREPAMEKKGMSQPPPSDSMGELMSSGDMEESSPPAASPSTPQKVTATKKKPAVKKWVVVSTRKSRLRVRQNPSLNAKVLFHLNKGAVLPLLESKPHWFKVSYAKGKSGWISRKWSKLSSK